MDGYLARRSGFGLLLLLATGAAAAPQAPDALAVTAVTVIDTTGGPPRPNMTVVIRDGRIVSVERGGPVPADAQIVDGRGRFLLPGLWDMHVHLGWTTPSALPLLVANGVTGVRDMGGPLGQIDALRARIEAGRIVGPRIARAGPILNGKAFNPLQLAVTTPDEARGVARALKHVGVDFLKVHRRLPRDCYFALIEEAKRLSLPVAGHVPMTVTPEEASDAGQLTLEHAETLFEGTFAAGLDEGALPAAIERFRAEGAGKLFARFAQNRTAVTPTLVAYRSVLSALDPAAPSDPRLRYVARSLLEQSRKLLSPLTAEQLAGMKKMFAELQQVTRQLNLAGVTLTTGTDLALGRVPGFSLHDELALLVDAGLEPLQALQAATLTPARLLNRESELGRIEAGWLADLVLLDADPLADIRNTQRIAAVVLAGRLLGRSDLDALLREAEASAPAN
jgi:imidazolonepropionase-like amidohydrolase